MFQACKCTVVGARVCYEPLEKYIVSGHEFIPVIKNMSQKENSQAKFSLCTNTYTHIYLLRNNIVKLFICPLGKCGSNGEAVQIHYSLPTSQFPGPYFPINRCLVDGKMSAESQRRKVFNFKKKTIFPIQSLPGVCVASTLKDRVSVYPVLSREQAVL